MSLNVFRDLLLNQATHYLVKQMISSYFVKGVLSVVDWRRIQEGKTKTKKITFIYHLHGFTEVVVEDGTR